MITPLPNELLQEIQSEVKEQFNVDVDSEFIQFIQRLQSEVAVEEGFAKQKTVRFFNLAVFLFNTKKRDAINTFNRLLKKYNYDHDKAMVEFRKLGKVIAIQEKEERDNRLAEQRRQAAIYVKPKATVYSTCGKYEIR